MSLGSYQIQLETPDEPDHIASFPQTRLDLSGNDHACFELYKRKNKRQLNCTFEVGDHRQSFSGAQVKQTYNTSSGDQISDQPTYAMLYVDKTTGIATLRPAVLHTLKSEKSDMLDELEAQIMRESNLDNTMNSDERTQDQMKSEYTHSFGSKQQKNIHKNAQMLKNFADNKFVSEAISSKQSKTVTEFTTSEGASNVVPPRNIDEKQIISKVYEFKKMFPEDVLKDLMAHSEDMAELGESDLGFVSSTYGEICSNLITTNVFSVQMVRDGSHMTEEERSLAFGWLTVVMRIFKIFKVEGQRWKQAIRKEYIEENLWGRLKLLGPSVRPWIEKNFLQTNEEEEKYVLPKFGIDKLQSWILVVVLLLSNFKTEFRPFAEFFQTTSSAFDKIIMICGAGMNNKSDNEAEIKLKFPLQGLNSGKKRGVGR